MKKLVFIFLFFLLSIGAVFANSYLLFYGQGCPHCEKVRNYLKEFNLFDKIAQKEVYFHKDNQKLFDTAVKKLNLKSDEVGVPFLLIDTSTGLSYVMGDYDVIHYVSNHQNNIKNSTNFNLSLLNLNSSVTNPNNFWKFLLLLIPAAISDSINPCAFAVMLILLTAILTRYKDIKKVYKAGFLFIFAVFISYFLMGLGLYKALANISSTIYLKVFVGILGILVGLANLKDAFWYGKGFLMEVPLSWRPKLKKIINSVTSPLGAFLIGFVVSLFLLPCTSGPYITILGYLASESAHIKLQGYLYLLIYNIIFVFPMFLITFFVAEGIYTTETLLAKKEKYVKVIHLIVGLLMLALGIYVLYDAGIFNFLV